MTNHDEPISTNVDEKLDRPALNIAQAIHRRIRAGRRAEIQRLEAEAAAELQSLLDEREAT